MIVDIINDVITGLKTSATGVGVYRSNPPVSPTFPLIIVSELSNSTHESTRDSSGTKHCEVGIQIEIYTTGTKKISDGASIRNLVDFLMEDTYGLSRTESQEVPNYSDTDVYRYILRYNGIVDVNKTIYRG